MRAADDDDAMADNEQRTAQTPPGSGQDAPPKSGGDELAADVPRAPAGLQDPPADPGEPMNPA